MVIESHAAHVRIFRFPPTSLSTVAVCVGVGVKVVVKEEYVGDEDEAEAKEVTTYKPRRESTKQSPSSRVSHGPDTTRNIALVGGTVGGAVGGAVVGRVGDVD